MNNRFIPTFDSIEGNSGIRDFYQEKDKTQIWGGKLCKRIIGLDANALYLWAISQPMLCGENQRVDTYVELIE